MKTTEQGPAPVYLGAFDAHVTPMTADDLLRDLRARPSFNSTKIVANHNLHSIYLHFTNPSFRDFYKRADIVLVDGFPILMAARRSLRKSSSNIELSAAHRVGSLDWIRRLDDDGLNIRKVAIIGATRESNNRAVSILSESHPFVQYEGWDGASWSNEKAQSVCEAVTIFQPDVILVGLGMPLQEEFISRYQDALPPAVIATIGGAIDQISGAQAAAPRWLGRLGVEWFWRLVAHPKKLGPRYLVEPWKLMMLVVKNRIN